MELTELVEDYLCAWNEHNVDGVLNLLHEGAAFYDAFWRENCVGHDLEQYLYDAFEEEAFHYRQIGSPIPTDHGVVYRYSAHRTDAGDIGEVEFEGAEVFTIRDGRILTVSDFYCDPDRESLIEVADLAAKRHGESNFAKSGFSAIKSLRIRDRFAALARDSGWHDDTALSAAQLAGQLDCTVEQLFQAMNVVSESELHEFIRQFNGRDVSAADSASMQGKQDRDACV